MKKKIIFVSLIIIGLFITTGCNKKVEDNKEKITIKDNKLKYTTTFEYEKEDGFKFKKNVDGGRFSEIEFDNEKENLTFDMYYTESTSENAKMIKQNRKENQKYYKEYKFGEYKGYIYSDYNDDLYVVITLKEDIKEKSTVDLFVSIETINYDKDAIVYDMFSKDVIMKFFKSIKNTVD